MALNDAPRRRTGTGPAGRDPDAGLAVREALGGRGELRERAHGAPNTTRPPQDHDDDEHDDDRDGRGHRRRGARRQHAEQDGRDPRRERGDHADEHDEGEQQAADEPGAGPPRTPAAPRRPAPGPSARRRTRPSGASRATRATRPTAARRRARRGSPSGSRSVTRRAPRARSRRRGRSGRSFAPLAAASSLRRRLRTCPSIARSYDSSENPCTASSSWDRVQTRPGSRASVASSSNSVGVRGDPLAGGGHAAAGEVELQVAGHDPLVASPAAPRRAAGRRGRGRPAPWG